MGCTNLQNCGKRGMWKGIGGKFLETGQTDDGGPSGQRLSGCMKQMVVDSKHIDENGKGPQQTQPRFTNWVHYEGVLLHRRQANVTKMEAA